ncbi:MAG: T9SS type A sorting domain-containing protein [Candidatus Aegiribacteria sp.]|nr:T9SS type A sorting domain-containing protein [Candidatus Aegiribacteria sp.]
MDLIVAGSPMTWWDIFTYSDSGYLTSSILDTECEPQWASVDWEAVGPEGTELCLTYRTSDNASSMGSWSDPLYAPSILSGILDRYFQYRFELETTNSFSSPVIHEISINWDPLSVENEDDSTLPVMGWLSILPNPSSGSPFIRFSLPESGSVGLGVFDLSGRIIQKIEENEYSAGYHDVQLENLSSGIYFCRMTAGGFTATQRFVVIE